MANVHTLMPADDHVAREPHLAEIEAQWGPVPGKQLTDGRSLFVLGAQFGNVFVGVQPGFGYEGDPMRLLFERGFAPTHAFSAFYRYLREDFGADAVLHFGTHGALEFMPGKQTGHGRSCWPDRLIGDLPNYYLYAANNPSEGMIAKRRAGATLISYLTPPITRADLYKGLQDLKGVDRALAGTAGRDETSPRRARDADPGTGRRPGLCAAEPAGTTPASDAIEILRRDLIELEETLIPTACTWSARPSAKRSGRTCCRRRRGEPRTDPDPGAGPDAARRRCRRTGPVHSAGRPTARIRKRCRS
jgi:magnesium chelatase subunit H